MQRLEVFQSLWAMSQRRPDGAEWSLEQQFEMISSVGFDGIDVVYGDVDENIIVTLLDKYSLSASVTAFPDSARALQPAIDMASRLDSVHLNIIGKVYPFSIEEGASYVRAWLEMCDAANLVATIETHRDCLTTDLLYTLQLMDAMPEMDLCADLSHFVVAREFSWPISDLVESQIEAVLDRSIAFQGRIASREQIQLQISFQQHRQWYDLFAKWWQYGFESWKKRADENATLNFLCELGPREYAMTGADGYELSDRWEEALIIKKRVASIWQGLD